MSSGVVLHQATGKTLSDYLREKIWGRSAAKPMPPGSIDAEGQEVAHFGFNAVLRDYARLGRLLAHDGVWDGKQIVPAQWMIDATTVTPQDGYLAPGKATPGFGYGYLLWLLHGDRRQFALFGDWGQRVCVDPNSKLIMVQTGTRDHQRGLAVVVRAGQAVRLKCPRSRSRADIGGAGPSCRQRAAGRRQHLRRQSFSRLIGRRIMCRKTTG